MSKALFVIDRDSRVPLQRQLRERISEAIASGVLAEGAPLPSTRALADYLDVARNTVTLAYQDLASEGLLAVRRRHGFFVAANAVGTAAAPPERAGTGRVEWQERLAIRPAQLRHPSVPPAWREKRYAFVYGQHDRWMFPIRDWRKCSRDSLSLNDVHDWTVDYVDGDDPLLLDAFRRRILPRRGFSARSDEILVTVGAQHALFLAAQALIKPATVVGVEEPSYVEARNIFALLGATTRPLPVDDEGLIVDERVAGCSLVYVTPSQQAPTTVTMSARRRRALLQAAARHDLVIIEDDYDTESRFGGEPSPALRSLDGDGRVIYLTSLSKLLSPGLRVGFLVGPPAFIEAARVLRRLGIRHPPANNQRTLALFLRGGHYESLLKRFHQEYALRRSILCAALRRHLPGCTPAPSQGGSSLWIKAPGGVDTAALAAAAYDRDVLIEAGAAHFAGPARPSCFFRLGYSSIKAPDIEDGVKILADVMREQLDKRLPARPDRDRPAGGGPIDSAAVALRQRALQRVTE